VLAGLCAGDFAITITDSVGCIITDSLQITEPSLLHANVQHTNETVAGDDGIAWASPSGGTLPYQYQWSNGSTDSLIMHLLPGLYTVIVSDTAGCVDTQTVEVLPFICFQMNVTQVQGIICHGDCSGALSAVIHGGTGPFRFEWNTGDTTSMNVDLCSGFYGVTVTDETQGCSVFVDFELTQPDSFYIVLDTILHLTDSTVTAIHISVVGGVAPFTHGWLGPNEFLSFEEDLMDIEPGFYFGWTRDSAGCVAFQDTIEVRDETVGLENVMLENIRLNPNPANKSIILDAPYLTEFETSLVSMNGQEMEAWKNQTKMEIAHIPSGFYFLKIISGGKTLVKPVVIQHSCFSK
jgi:hypothetical protein